MFPAIWISGLIYLTYGLWGGADSSGTQAIVANPHLLAGYDEIDLTPNKQPIWKSTNRDRSKAFRVRFLAHND